VADGGGDGGPGEPGELVLLDACCLINLFATGHADEIVRALPYRFAVARYVAEEEVLKVAGESGDTSIHPDLADLIERGSVARLDVSSGEEMRYLVRFAIDLDDGEAHTCALAIVRSARVATDDRKAIRVFRAAREEPATEPCLRTSELLFEWAAVEGVGAADLAEIVRAVARRASFLPPRDDPHVERWLDLLDRDEP
jgi:predicted nucleic acid-binding protein